MEQDISKTWSMATNAFPLLMNGREYITTH